MATQAEQTALANTLKSPSQGGAAVSGGSLGAGADVPKVLAEDPATKQLLQESVYTQTGQKDKAIASSQDYTKQKAPTVVTSDQASSRNSANQQTLNNINAQTAQDNANRSNTTGATSTTRTTTPTSGNTTESTEVDPLQGKIDSASAAIDAEYAQADALLTSRMSSLSEQSKAQIAQIQATYAARREETKRLNEVLLQSNTKAGIRAGRQRYAPEINQGILTDVEQQGLARITQLDNEEQQLIMEAQAANDSNQFNLLSQQLEMVSAKRKEKEAAISALNKAAMEQEIFALDKAKAERELRKFERDDASGTIDAMVAGGVDPDSLPPDYFAKLDTQAGFAPGVSQGLFEFGLKEKDLKSTEDQFKRQQMEIEQAAAMNNLLMDLPIGQSVTIGGTEYASLNKGETSVFKEYDGQGNMNLISYNQDTGAYSVRAIQGVAPEDGWEFQEQNGVGMFINPNTQETRIAYDSSQYNKGMPTNSGIYNAFPEGSYGGECAIYCENTTTFGGPMDTYNGKVEHSFRAKMTKTDPSVTFEDVTPGMIGVLNMGSYGHVVTVLGTTSVNGVKKVQVTESNLDGKGTVTYGEYDASQIKGYIPAQLKPEYQFGSGGLGNQAGGINEEEAIKRFSGDGEQAQQKVTEAQRVTAGYAARTVQAEQALSSLEEKIGGLSSAALLYQRNLPQALKSEDMKLYEQAERNFINSVLRRESGAAISSDEYKSARAQYFVQPGDTPTVMEQKKKNRELVQRELINSSGAAYNAPSQEFLSGGSVTEESLVQQYPAYSQKIQELLSEGMDINEIQEVLSNL